MDKPVNYTREAFLHPLNLAFLITASTSAFFLSGHGTALSVIFSVTVAFELIYLGIVPRLPRFQKYINLRSFKERNSRFQERKIFGNLNEEGQKKFLILKHIAGLIKGNFAKLPYPSHGLLDSINTRIDSLLTSYMLLLDSSKRYEQYLETPVESRLRSEIEKTSKEIETTDSQKLKQVLNRRQSILHKRLEKYGVAREKYLISESQLKTIEDTIRYIYEKSMTMSNLEEIEHQMDSLMLDLDDTDTIYSEWSSDLNGNGDILSEIRDLDNQSEETRQVVDRVKN